MVSVLEQGETAGVDQDALLLTAAVLSHHQLILRLALANIGSPLKYYNHQLSLVTRLRGRYAPLA